MYTFYHHDEKRFQVNANHDFFAFNDYNFIMRNT